MKNITNIFFLFLAIIVKAQPGFDREFGIEMVKTLNAEIKRYPDSLNLREKRIDYLNLLYDYEKANEDIEYLLYRDSINPNFIKNKIYYLIHSRNIFNLNDSLPKYVNAYLKYEPNATKKSNLLMYSIGRTYENINSYEKAIFYGNKALEVNPEKTSDVRKYKHEIYHKMKRYNEAFEMLDLNIDAVKYHSLYLNNPQLSKKILLKVMNNSFKENFQNDKFVFIKNEKYLKYYINEFVFIEYKLGNEEKAIQLLYDFVKFDFENIFLGDRFFISKYWNTIQHLYANHKDDYRLNIILAYYYSNYSHDMVDFRHEEDVILPKKLKELEFLSWGDIERKIRGLGLEELSIAEKLSKKDYSFYRSIIFREQEKFDKALEIQLPLLKVEPENYSYNLALSLTYLQMYHSNDEIYKKYSNKAHTLEDKKESLVLHID